MSSLAAKIAVMLCGIALFGCGVDIGEIAPKATQRIFRDGRIYALYNGRPAFIAPGVWRARTLLIIYEGQRIAVPPNMTMQQEPTLQGAVQITPDLLPGGTAVDLEFEVWTIGDMEQGKFSDYFGGPLVIDGDVTIEFYDDDWSIDPFSAVLLKVISGRYDAPHIYSWTLDKVFPRALV